MEPMTIIMVTAFSYPNKDGTMAESNPHKLVPSPAVQQPLTLAHRDEERTEADVREVTSISHHRPFSLGVATITPTRRGRCRPMSTLRAKSGCSAALMTVLMMPT